MEKEDKYWKGRLVQYARAAEEAALSGRSEEAGKYYAWAAQVSESLGNLESASYFMKRAKEVNKKLVKINLDRHVKGIYIFLLFLATMFFSTPQIRGAVVGVSFGAFSYMEIVFFIALLIALNLKVYAKMK